MSERLISPSKQTGEVAFRSLAGATNSQSKVGEDLAQGFSPALANFEADQAKSLDFMALSQTNGSKSNESNFGECKGKRPIVSLRLALGPAGIKVALSPKQPLLPVHESLFDSLDILVSEKDRPFRSDIIKISEFLTSISAEEFAELLAELAQEGCATNLIPSYDYESVLNTHIDSCFGIKSASNKERLTEALSWVKASFPEKELDEIKYPELMAKVLEQKTSVLKIQYPNKTLGSKRIFKATREYLSSKGFDTNHTLCSFVGLGEFLEIIKSKIQWKDPNLFPIHGESTHMFQIAALCKAIDKKELVLDHPIAEIVSKLAIKIDLKKIKDTYSLNAFSPIREDYVNREMRSLWVLLLDNALGGVQIAQSTKTVVQTFSSPFFTHKFLCKHFPEIQDRQAKRWAEWRCWAPLEILFMLAVSQIDDLNETNVLEKYRPTDQLVRTFTEIKSDGTSGKSEKFYMSILGSPCTFTGLKWEALYQSKTAKDANIKGSLVPRNPKIELGQVETPMKK